MGKRERTRRFSPEIAYLQLFYTRQLQGKKKKSDTLEKVVLYRRSKAARASRGAGELHRAPRPAENSSRGPRES